MATDVRLTEAGFDPGTEIAAFARAHTEAGGIVSFTGQVRSGDAVEALELTHYGQLTLPGMLPGEPIVLVAAAARHRRDAFAAADFAMDHLKSESWFWKREKRAGEWRWVEPRTEDYADLARWG